MPPPPLPDLYRSKARVVETGDTQPLNQTQKLAPLSEYDIIKAGIAARFVTLRHEFARGWDRALLRGLRR
jgi:hypothetical protein